MPRKEKKYHFIYKTTNLLSGRYYIGMHSTDDLDDGYLGSGSRLKKAIKKHGKENFKREILEFVKDRKTLAEREAKVVNLDLIAREECMNLKVGGHGGWPESANERFKWLLENDEEFKEKQSKIMTETLLNQYKNGRVGKFYYDWTGKEHSEETKKKISETNKGNCKGDNNSQYGTCWITKDEENKKIKKGDLEYYIQLGWIKGRVSKIKGSNITTSKLTENDVIEIKKLINEGNLTLKKIGLLYSVKGETIGKIKKGETWSHVKI